MTKIYLIRHAEAEGNLYRMAHGHYNGMITNYRGYQQIDALRQRFQDVDIDAVYASDLYRTQITSRAIWLPKALPLHLEPAFREIHMGVWENHTWHELNKAYPQEMYHFNRRVDLWHVEGGETAQDVLDRYLPALHRVGAAHDGGTVAVFSHGAALRIVLGTLQGVPLSGIGETPHGDNTAVSLLTWDNGQLRVEYRDANSHLTARGLSTFANKAGGAAKTWWTPARIICPCRRSFFRASMCPTAVRPWASAAARRSSARISCCRTASRTPYGWAGTGWTPPSAVRAAASPPWARSSAPDAIGTWASCVFPAATRSCGGFSPVWASTP